MCVIRDLYPEMQLTFVNKSIMLVVLMVLLANKGVYASPIVNGYPCPKTGKLTLVMLNVLIDSILNIKYSVIELCY